MNESRANAGNNQPSSLCIEGSGNPNWIHQAYLNRAVMAYLPYPEKFHYCLAVLFKWAFLFLINFIDMKDAKDLIKSARGFSHSVPEDSVEYTFTKKQLYDLLSKVCEDQKEICNEYCTTSCLCANWPEYVYKENY